MKDSACGLCESDIAKTFPWMLKVEIPAGLDKKKKPIFKVRRVETELNYLSEHETDEILEYLRNPNADDDDESDGKEKKNNRYFARKILHSFNPEHFLDADGKPIPCDEEGIERFLNIPYVCDAILKAFRNSRGGKSAQRGN